MNGRFPDRNKTRAATRNITASVGIRPRPSLVHKMLDAQRRERTAVLSEFVKVRGLMPLLMKHRNGDTWSRAERIELQEQLRALAHLSPYLFVIMLPGSFALLPVLAWWLDRRRHQREDRATGSSA